MSPNKTHPDLEPLIESHGAGVAAKNNNKWRFNRKVKFPGLSRRRDLNGYQEKCGRIKLGAILCFFALLVLYLSNIKSYQNIMIVRVPEDDVNLPGPKGMYNLLIMLFAFFAVFFIVTLHKLCNIFIFRTRNKFQQFCFVLFFFVLCLMCFG